MNVFNKIIEILDKEHFASRRDFHELLAKDIYERVENHTCIDDLILRQKTSGFLILNCAQHHARFRKGDRVILSLRRKNGMITPVGEMEYESWDDQTGSLFLKFPYGADRQTYEIEPGDSVVVDDAGLSLNMVIKANLLNIRDHKLLMDYFSGQLQNQVPDFDHQLYETICQKMNLNKKQADALRQTVSSYPVYAVQGPPGTGKTYLISAIAVYYLSKGIEICITAVSHFAINHALNMVSKVVKKFNMKNRIIKVSKHKNDNLSEDVQKVSSVKSVSPVSQPDVYGFTPFKFAHEIGRNRFRLIIMDEASQASVPFSAMVMSYTKKCVLVGDHKQLGPVSNYPFHDNLFGKSVFAFHAAYYPSLMTMLNETYRMGTQLLSLPSSLFYNNLLKSSSPLEAKPDTVEVKNQNQSVDDRKNSIAALYPHIPFEKIFHSNVFSFFLRLSHKYCGKYSNEEAFLTGALCHYMLCGLGMKSAELAVLTPFRAQQNRIKYDLSRISKKTGVDFSDVLVDTVERMQGQERDVIIYSLTASDSKKLSQMAEFFFEPGRFNVALTRARKRRFVLGSEEILKTYTDDPEVLKGISCFADFFASENVVDINTPFDK